MSITGCEQGTENTIRKMLYNRLNYKLHCVQILSTLIIVETWGMPGTY